MEGEEEAKQTFRTEGEKMSCCSAQYVIQHHSTQVRGNVMNNNKVFLVHLKVLVVARVDAETRNKAVHHQLHIGVLAPRPSPEGFGWVEQQSLRTGEVMSSLGHFL